MGKPGEMVVIAGLGYVGLPLALASLEAGYRVVGVETNALRVDAIKRGHSYLNDVSEEQLRAAIRSQNFIVQSSYSELPLFDFGVVTVPTPLEEGKPDLRQILSAAQSLAAGLTQGSTIILESTTYPGTTDEVLVPLLQKATGLKVGESLFVGYSPERIDPGNKTWNLLNTPKLVSGVDKDSLAKVSAFYSSLGVQCVPVSGTRNAELAKLIENTFRHVNIALINEIALFAQSLGADIFEAVDAAATKPFGFMSFFPSIGVGGHCLPIDTSYLGWAISRQSGQPFRFGNLANEVNEAMPIFVAEKILRKLREEGIEPGDARVLVMGLAYKPDSGDIRESPAVELAELLTEAGVSVHAEDELVEPEDWPPRIARVSLLEQPRFSIGVFGAMHTDVDWDPFIGCCDFVLGTSSKAFGHKTVPLWTA